MDRELQAKAMPPFYFLDAGSKFSAAPKVFKTNSFLFLSVLVVANQRHLASLASIVLISLLESIYPLYHGSGARHIRSTPRPSFDPLMVDPLAIVAVEEIPEP
ncbi:hypothetical protein AMTR_s00140p00041960 [Amborella trichopoda]|uniref:Uncharacterized protein n=1 Tax=Amborella trichopoda TaxID=13333 RepID=W1PA25_AMBTC|nr:hypothetical protein AMTR_s00140p00041960 [Amborella trichopoda]